MTRCLAGLQVVAEDGTMISKSGIMTGGDSTVFESKMKRWASGERDKLEEKYRKNHAALEVPCRLCARPFSLPSCCSRSDRAERRVPVVTNMCLSFACPVQACKASITQIDAKRSKDRRDRDDVENKLKQVKSRKEESEGLLKNRKTEVEVMKKQDKEFKEKIDALNEVSLQYVISHTSSFMCMKSARARERERERERDVGNKMDARMQVLLLYSRPPRIRRAL